jgi:hypothetical protein
MTGIFLPFVAIQIVTQPGAGRTDAGRRTASPVSFVPSDEDITATSWRSKAPLALHEYHVFQG